MTSRRAKAQPEPEVKRRTFVVEFFVEVEVAQALLDSVLTDEWRAQMYPFHTPEQVAEHLAFNLVQGTSLDNIDGYADQDPKSVKIGSLDISHCYESKPEPKPKPCTRPKKLANDQRSKNR